MALVFFHGLQKFIGRFRNRPNRWRHHKFKRLFAHIPLALHAEGSNTVTGDLRQQRTRYPLNAKRKHGMFNGTFMPNLREHFHKRSRFFGG